MLTNNPKDPLIQTGPELQRILLERFAEACRNMPQDAVIGAAMNLLVNAVRQTYPKLSEADARFAELLNRSRGLLAEHYDPVTGRRRSTFAHTQIIQAAHVVDDDVFRQR